MTQPAVGPRILTLAQQRALLQWTAKAATWLRVYADATDWHAYVPGYAPEGTRMDPEVDALLAELDEIGGLN